ncbi:hypothetical protein NX059_003264 [Plenodomus lindquistii]|nr:hypothetical protein NX059_003264 [Plenodomus lindquistii]
MEESKKPAPAAAVPNYHGFIQVLVGKDGKEQFFDVHEELITSRSAFFKAAMSGNWQESKERCVKLPEDDAPTFKLYLHFLYTGKIAITSEALDARIEARDHIRTIARLYILAEKLQDVITRNATVEEMLEACRTPNSDGETYCMGTETVNIIYEGSPPGSPMRRLVVDIYTCRATKDWSQLFQLDNAWPRDFLPELVSSLIAKRTVPKDVTRSGNASRYLEVIEPRANP